VNRLPAHRHLGWHWPTFEKILCGTMTDRERLGLPDYYVSDRFGSSLPEVYERLRGHGKTALATHCQDASAPLIDRLAAGNLLAVLGDPRIDTPNPAMIAITGRSVEIGLCAEDLGSVLTRYTKLGLDRKWFEKECPRHTVHLKTYAIAKYPVTNQEYRDFLLDTCYVELPSSWTFRRYPREFSNHPVYSLSPEAADAYAGWLARATGRAFRLPTEAEWEFAAAGPAGLEFPWGQDFDADPANTAETGLFQSSAVGVFVDGNSPFGAADMAGNVEEYVSDDYAPYPGSSFITDHLMEIHGGYRVARGGSFARFRDLARTRRRHGQNPRSAAYAMGFRLAEDLEER
jgi:formylglycine-generating enzyme required for sulfatase activity